MKPLKVLISMLTSTYIKNFYLFIITTLSLCLSSCEPNSEIDTKALSKEVKNRKIKRVSASDILSIAETRGQQTVQSLEKNWKEALNQALESKGKEYAKKFCIVPFIPGFDTISKNCTSIKKLGSTVQMSSKADSLEKIILEAYSYNVQNKLPLTPSIQREGNEFILYTAPIFYDATSCSQCHIKNNILPDSTSKYAGFWSVKFSKKQLLEVN